VASSELLLNKEEALNRVDGDRELLSELITTFLNEYPKTLQALQTAVNAGDAKAVELHAHSIKGAMRNFGNSKPIEVAFELEKIGRSADLTRAAELFESVKSEVAKFAGALRNWQIDLE